LVLDGGTAVPGQLRTLQQAIDLGHRNAPAVTPDLPCSHLARVYPTSHGESMYLNDCGELLGGEQLNMAVDVWRAVHHAMISENSREINIELGDNAFFGSPIVSARTQ